VGCLEPPRRSRTRSTERAIAATFVGPSVDVTGGFIGTNLTYQAILIVEDQQARAQLGDD
jgi:hypothetical protein